MDTIYIVYLNDILIYLNDEDKYIKYIKQVLRQLYTWSLYAKLSKCIFYTKNVEFLGFIITPNSIVMDPTCIKAFKE